MKIGDTLYVGMKDSAGQYQMTGEIVSLDNENELIFVKDAETGLIFGIDWMSPDYAEVL